MRSALLTASLVTLLASTAACGDDATSETGGSGAGASTATGGSGAGGGDTGGSDTGAGGTGGQSTFDPAHPGVYLFLSLGGVTMMSQPMELAAAGFMPGAREDHEPAEPGEELPLDTCVSGDGPAPTPSCAGEDDCAPEQDCLPETDSNGDPIAGTNRCVTPRDPIDVGPLTLEGFASGPIELRYNSGQNGAYTPDGTGDGQLEPGTLTYGVSYTFHGDGAPTYELGAFAGQVEMPEALAITAPALIELPDLPGMMGLPVDPDVDLVLQWSGGSPGGVLRINLAAQGDGVPVNCRASDDGELVIPAAMLQAAQLGDMAFFNMMTIERVAAPGSASGDGLVRADIGVLATLVLNVAKQ